MEGWVMIMVIRILDLFSGMGGLSLGFALGLKNTLIRGLDIDRFAVQTYNYNLSRFNAEAEVRDVLKWEPEGEYDVIIGGVPCQPYSFACVKRRGKEHPLYPTLPRFFDVVLELRPKVFLMENVKGLVSKRHKPLLEEQLRRVEPHYKIGYRVLNAAHYGVPQRRERLFVLGIRKDLGIAPSFPKQTHAESEQKTLFGRIYRWVTVREAIGDLLSIPPQGLMFTHKRSLTVKVIEGTWRPTFTSEEPSFTVTNSGLRAIIPEHEAITESPDSLDKLSRTISSNTVEGSKMDTIVVPITEHVMTAKGGWDSPKSEWGSRVIPDDVPSYTITEKHRSGQLVRIPSSAWLAKHPPLAMNKPSNTIASNTGKNKKWVHNAIIDGGVYRRLSVRECLRLQSFPDWWSFPEGVSVSRKYKLVGEAVPPALAYRVAVHVGKLMGWGVREPPKPEEWALPFFKRMFEDYFNR